MPSKPQHPRQQPADTGRGIILCASLILSAVVYSFHFTSFLHSKEIVLSLAITAIALLNALSKRLDKQGFTAFLPLWIFIALALAGAAVTHACVPSEVLTKTASCLLLVFGVALVFDLFRDPAWRTRVTYSIGISAALIAALGLLQYAGKFPYLFPVFPQYTQRVYSVFGNQDLYGAYLALAIPILLHAAASGRRFRYAALPGLAITIPGIAVSGSRTAWLAAFLGAAVVLTKSLPDQAPRKRLLAATILSFVLIALMTHLTPETTRDRIAATFKPEDRGLQSRLWMWRGTLRMIGDAPILGVGLNNFACWSPRYLGESLQGPNGNPRILGEIHADQPHSEPLRILAETGIAGAACWLWMAMRLLRAARSAHRRDALQSACAGALLALAACSLFNGTLDSPPHVFAGMAIAGILIVSPRDKQESPPRQTRSHAVAAAACVSTLSLFLLASVWIPSYLLRSAEDAHLASQPDLSLYIRAVNYPWPDAKAHKEYGFALAEAGRNGEANQQLLAALKGADTGDIYLALAILASRRNDIEAAHHWAAQCLLRWPGNKEAQELTRL